VNSDERRAADVAALATERGLSLFNVGDDRWKLIDISTRRVVADDWSTHEGLPLERLEQALATVGPP
jgi:predicted benzoate:H+ symporter BenE